MRKSKDRRSWSLSKYLSKYLRHGPEELGLALMPGGWVEVDALLAASAHRDFPISRDELEEVVARNDKKRFAPSPGRMPGTPNETPEGPDVGGSKSRGP